MLVLVPGKVINTVLVSPIERSGKVFRSVHFPGIGGVLYGTISEDSFFNSACTFCELWHPALFESICDICGVLRLGHRVDGLVIERIVLLGLSSDVHDWFGPGILGCCPGTVALNVEVVGSTAEFKETIHAPVSSPRVSNEPIVLAVFNTISNDGNIVADLHITGIVTEDATSVGMKRISCGHTAGDWTSLVNFLNHVLLSRNSAIFIDSINVIFVGDEASFTRIAVSAHIHG